MAASRLTAAMCLQVLSQAKQTVTGGKTEHPLAEVASLHNFHDECYVKTSVAAQISCCFMPTVYYSQTQFKALKQQFEWKVVS